MYMKKGVSVYIQIILTNHFISLRPLNLSTLCISLTFNYSPLWPACGLESDEAFFDYTG
jgi:hypothetical protein